MVIPAFTLSPICSSDICTDFPFSRVTRDVDGKHPPEDDLGGGGGGGGGVDTGMSPVHQQTLSE